MFGTLSSVLVGVLPEMNEMRLLGLRAPFWLTQKSGCAFPLRGTPGRDYKQKEGCPSMVEHTPQSSTNETVGAHALNPEGV